MVSLYLFINAKVADATPAKFVGCSQFRQIKRWWKRLSLFSHARQSVASNFSAMRPSMGVWNSS